MPNHVWNTLTVSGEKDEVTKFVEFAEGEYPWREGNESWNEDVEREIDKLSCNSFIPAPQEAINNYSNVGYEWCIKIWGTKWGCYDVSIEGNSSGTSVWYGFNTAWSPPVPVVYKMIEMFPDLRFCLHFREGATGFQGWVKGVKGIVTVDKTASYSWQEGG